MSAERTTARIWGRNLDGSPYAVGMTVAQLRDQLADFKDTDEICVAVCDKKNLNGGGLLGQLKELGDGVPGQIWLKATVIDESLES